MKPHRVVHGFILNADGEQIANMCCGAPIYYKRVIDVIEQKRDPEKKRHVSVNDSYSR